MRANPPVELRSGRSRTPRRPQTRAGLGAGLRQDGGFDSTVHAPEPAYDFHYGMPLELDKLTLTSDRRKLTPGDENRLMEALRNNRASE